MLYLPIWVFSGWRAVFQNTWVQPLTPAQWFEEFPSYGLTWLQLPFGEGVIPGFLTVIVLLAMVLYRFQNKKWQLLHVCHIGLITIPWLLFSVQHVFPPQRTWLFQLSILFVYWAATWEMLAQQWGKWIRPIAWCFVIGWNGWQLHEMYSEWSSPQNIYRQVDRAAEWIYQHNAQRVFVGKDIYNVFLQLEYRTKNQRFTVETNRTFISQQFDFWIIPITWNAKALPPTKLVYQDDYVRIYQKK